MFSAQLHPEFGYLCPSSRVRRVFWAGLVLAVFGLIAGAASLRPMIGHDPDTGDQLVAALDQPAADPRPAIRSEAAGTLRLRPQLSSTTVAKADAAKSDPAKACEEMTWAYLDGKCVAGKTRKPRVVRVPTHRPAIALIPIGRNASAGTDISASKAANSQARTDGKPAASKSAANASTADTASSTPDPALQAFAATKKPQRTAQNRSHRRSRSGHSDPWSRADRWGWRGTAQAWSW